MCRAPSANLIGLRAKRQRKNYVLLSMMSTQRRFSDDEVSRILEQATTTEAAIASGGDGQGLTLVELQDVARQVGISPDRIAAAARDVTTPELAPTSRTFMGAPMSVARTVYTDRPLGDDEWLRLVAALRETFDTRGRVSAVGSLRSWTNGNLQVHEEPSADGYRIRMRTRKGDAMSLALVGTIFAILGGLMLIKVIPHPYALGYAVSSLFIGGGVGVVGYTRLALGRWARERAAQMEALAARIPLLFAR